MSTLPSIRCSALLSLVSATMMLSASADEWPVDRLPMHLNPESAEPIGRAGVGSRPPMEARSQGVEGSAAKPTNSDAEEDDRGERTEDAKNDEERDTKSARARTLFQWSGTETEDTDDGEIEPITTDRPDFTEASSTVGAGVFQIETGYTFIEDRNDGIVVQTHSWGEPLFRLGAFRDWLEFRLAVFPVTERSTDIGTTSGVEDLYLGVKLALTEQSGWLPEMALTPQTTVPTGSSKFQNYATLAGINWLYGWDISECLSTAGSTQVNKAIDDDGDSYLEFAQSWTIGYTLTEKLGAYTEWFAFLPSGTQVALAEHYFDGGFTYKFTKDVQWDIRGGIGLNDAASDYFVGTGLSVRYR